MENASLPSDLWNNVTTSSSKGEAQTLYLANIRHLALKIVYIIIGTVGVLDNLFVIIVFLLFIKITDKVLAILKLFLQYTSTKGTMDPEGSARNSCNSWSLS